MTEATSLSTTAGYRQRICLTVHGVVQGMGFRPFVYRLAHELSLAGWVANTTQGAMLELEGEMDNLQQFQVRLQQELPYPASIHHLTATSLAAVGESEFSIRPSHSDGTRHAVISPDLATCGECLKDMYHPQSRRYRYPFTTCTHCGPRYSIARRLPYDRFNTTMDQFPWCVNCQKEYTDPANRRFHAETIACPACGPQMALWNAEGHVLEQQEEALRKACDFIRRGGILAVKGLGGFQLWVDARSSEAIQRLRQRKQRPAKPFAVLFPSIEVLRHHCLVSPEEQELLTSPAAPIVLLRKKNPLTLSVDLAPDNPYLGCMLPFTPLHHLLVAELQIPVVATSGNRSEEPLVVDEQDALDRLHGIAEMFLVHNRPIVRPVDDSVVRVVTGKIKMLRRARGYVPTPSSQEIAPKGNQSFPCTLAVGGHLKNTIAISVQNEILVSQHLGDLTTLEATTKFEQAVDDFITLFNLTPHVVACDLHPDYRSTRFAHRFGNQRRIPVIPVQHHHAHIAACMAEHQLSGPVLGVAWDGSGYGSEGTLWGGEFLLCEASGFRRIGHLRPFPLPGGEICMREPRRVALSLLHTLFGQQLFNLNLPPLHSLGPDLTRSISALLDKEVQCPSTSSMGRLFDGISAMLDVKQISSFEGEAAMALEFLAEQSNSRAHSSFYRILLNTPSQGGGPWVADWRPLLMDILHDLVEQKHPSEIAFGFHLALAQFITDVAKSMTGMPVILSGGVFQNGLLQRLSEQKLAQEGIHVYSPHLFGSNDGGLALGQCFLVGSTFHIT